MRTVLPVLWAVALPVAHAQVLTDRPIVLIGGADADRQVLGLADPTNGGDALNAGTFQRGSYHFASVNGTNWTVVLQPAPDTLIPGTELVLLNQDSITGPVSLTLNGLGPYEVVKDGIVDLAAGDLRAGAMVTVMFDGARFQLTSGRSPRHRECPSGAVAVNDRYCIGVVQNDTLSFELAAEACASQGGHLCSWGDWYNACTKASTLGITDMVGGWEWTNDAASADGCVRQVGLASCTHASARFAAPPPGLHFRCCWRR